MYVFCLTEGFLVGYAMATVTMSVIDAGVATVFVCFAEDPTALEATHPDHFAELLRAWEMMHYDIHRRCVMHAWAVREGAPHVA